MKKVLAFIDWYKPGYKAGGTITAFSNFVDYLEDDFEFNIITRDTDYCDKESYASVVSDEWNSISKSNVYYISRPKLNFKRIKKIISIESYDYVYVNGIFSFYFSVLPLLIIRNTQVIVNPHGMLSKQAFSIKNNKKIIFLKIINFLNLYNKTVFHVANEEEAQAVKERIKVFQEIKIANQLPRKLKHENFKKKIKKNEILCLISVARISPEKGTKYIFEFLSKIQNTKIVLDLYGPIYNKEYWKECQSVITKLPENITVNYKGSVDGSTMNDVLQNYHFFILPSEGENFGHAILEALSAGCPVIISDKTPWKSLESKKIGWDLPLDNPQKFVDAIEKASGMNQSIYNEWSNNAVTFAKKFCNNPEILEENRKLFL
ncbi:glycosyltransferase involved in cell wall biosynthesis [Flavobacterium sp. CG_9.1]|uniref:glycosyltransferase family 4 protein n=1 Tax=Flavobacterium sp. CG_9.1 TaxID=2787728 RepID=UPI0018CB7504|nr:glycosyltransferase family 4 protein [Flavobacterium sp. CG_9.1]MBG6062548.1 glycosyltransferase involved in cell wall biosynthesis [Flavobacterium sp. CG_9.1]